jgi:hypothetical protein
MAGSRLHVMGTPPVAAPDVVEVVSPSGPIANDVI